MSEQFEERSRIQEDINATNAFFQNYVQEKQLQEENVWKKKLKSMLQNIYFQIVITILVLFSLFSDDIRVAAFDASADLAFDITHIILIVVFAIEILLNFIALEEYRFSFYFFLDVISSLSLLLDITMIIDLIYQNNGDLNNSLIATQSRASRVAVRAVRIVKLVRIIRIVKLYKSASKAASLKEQEKVKKAKQNEKKQKLRYQRKKRESNLSKMGSMLMREEERMKKKNRVVIIAQQHDNSLKVETQREAEVEDSTSEIVKNKLEDRVEAEKSEEEDQSVFNSTFLEEISQNESKISKVLSNLTIQKVIIVVLLLMFIIPLFDSDNYLDNGESWDFLVISFASFIKNTSYDVNMLSGIINNQIDAHKGDNYIIYFSTPFAELPFYQNQRYVEERIQDVAASVQIIDTDEILGLRSDLTIRSDIKQSLNNKIYAVMNYRYNSQRIAIFSIAKTIFVCIVLIGLLHFFTEDINELIVAPIEKMMQQVMEMAKNPEAVVNNSVVDNKYQTGIVHNAIVKIGALLSLVFGSAGAEIIGLNIMKQGDMNPMIDGQKKCAIFGFCDIRNFNEVTQLLQEDIMLFVNKIGELVHSSVYRYGGSANKNIGQAFLMVWPLPDNTYSLNKKTNQITWINKDYVSIMSDFSVFSFIKAIVKIHKDPKVLEYKNDARLISGFGQYQLQMGFGIHIGWAIEGAIGSQYKIDASYLSPNVNMASRLEAATRQYGVNLLISEDLYTMLTCELKEYCRNIDRVTVKGSAKPIRLYTIDLNLKNISPPMDKSVKYKNPDDRMDVQIKKDLNLEMLDDDKIEFYDADDFVKKKKELREVMLDAVSEEFRKSFQSGLDHYLDGNWNDSRRYFNRANQLKEGDGPTNTLLKYMKRFDYKAPDTWQNYRPLTQK